MALCTNSLFSETFVKVFSSLDGQPDGNGG